MNTFTMRRHVILDSHILRIRPQGDRNAGILLLTREESRIWAQAFGFQGRTSRLRSSCQPFNTIRAWLFREPGRDLWRLEDAELLADAMDMRNSVEGIYLAAFFAELLERTPLEADGTWPWQFMEAVRTHAGKPAGTDAYHARLFCIMAWKYLACTGFAAEVESDLQSAGGQAIGEVGLAWLSATGRLPVARALEESSPPVDPRIAGRLLERKMEDLLGHPLRTFADPRLLGL